MKRVFTVRYIVYGALIAALYAGLTLAFAPLSYGLAQVRVSEALTVLPFFIPASIPGLFIGCLIANLVTGNIYDIIFGSLATLIAAFISSRIKNKYLVPLPPVICNAVIVGAVLTYAYTNVTNGLPYILVALQVGAGELVACYVIGLPLLLVLERHKNKIKV
ncbi:MAG: QueT transporter family protein [Bacillota bacterium]|nr:QueT transporter family protein [Bacillota bacterium]